MNAMKGSHIHVSVRNLIETVKWFKDKLNIAPAFNNVGMAVMPLGEFSLILDQGEEDTAITIAFDSSNCEKDFLQIRERGAEVLEEPSKQPWGVMAAYIKGPGKLIFEIEQVL